MFSAGQRMDFIMDAFREAAVDGIPIEVTAVLDDLLDQAIAVMDADFGNIQLLDRNDNRLRIVASRGFESEFLEFFAVVGGDDHSACAFALAASDRVVISDINISPFFVGKRSGEVLRDAKVRAVQSTPLVHADGNLLGMISIHWRDPVTPGAEALRRLDGLIARSMREIGGYVPV